MHPFVGLCHGGEIVYAVGAAYGVSGLFRWGPRLPSSVVLDEWYAVAAMFVVNSNEERFVVAGDEHVMFFMDGDPVFGEDGDGAVIGGFAYAHEGVREVLEGVSFGCCGREPFEWESGLVGGAADVAIGHSYLFGGGSEDRESGGEAVVLVDVMAVGPGVIGDGWDVIDGEVSDEGLVVEARVIGTAECSGESIPGIAAILEDGNWFGWR